jgi:partner of Y14 and mago protein
MRYRPARVREAEEARKKGIPGSVPTQSTAAAVASADSSASPRPSALPLEPPRFEAQRTTWRSNTQQRQTALAVNSREARSTASEADTPTASSHGEGSWRNSRLRKSADPSKKAVTSAGSSQDVRIETVDSATAKAESSVVSEALSSADELAQELDSLRIGKSDKPSQK